MMDNERVLALVWGQNFRLSFCRTFSSLFFSHCHLVKSRFVHNESVQRCVCWQWKIIENIDLRFGWMKAILHEGKRKIRKVEVEDVSQKTSSLILLLFYFFESALARFHHCISPWPIFTKKMSFLQIFWATRPIRFRRFYFLLLQTCFTNCCVQAEIQKGIVLPVSIELSRKSERINKVRGEFVSLLCLLRFIRATLKGTKVMGDEKFLLFRIPFSIYIYTSTLESIVVRPFVALQSPSANPWRGHAPKEEQMRGLYASYIKI